MRPRKGNGAIVWFAVIAMLALIALAGCARVEIVDSAVISTPDFFSNRPAAGDGSHNLAVIAVDFDPPLNYQQLIIQRRSVSLLAAVENSGNSTEQDVTVWVKLSAPDDTDLSQTRRVSITSIAPGEVRVVRFAHLGEIPYHQAYHLEVMVEPVDGESDYTDNLRAFDIQVHQGQDEP